METNETTTVVEPTAAEAEHLESLNKAAAERQAAADLEQEAARQKAEHMAAVAAKQMAKDMQAAKTKARLMCGIHLAATIAAATLAVFAASWFRTVEWVAPGFALALQWIATVIEAARIGYLVAILRHI